jgi:hypothetical protein
VLRRHRSFDTLYQVTYRQNSDQIFLRKIDSKLMLERDHGSGKTLRILRQLGLKSEAALTQGVRGYGGMPKFRFALVGNRGRRCGTSGNRRARATWNVCRKRLECCDHPTGD